MTAESGAALTLGELVDEAAAQLAQRGVVDATTSARRIAEVAAGIDPAEFATSLSLELTSGMVAHADAMLHRRAAGEPLQYVLGEWSFRRVDLAIDRRALIPRPETEIVAGAGIDELSGLGRPSLALDLGTGSGAIALALAHEVPNATVLATDSSREALALASANLAGLGRAAARVQLHHGSWFEAVDPSYVEQFDLVISNPPYVPSTDELPPEVAEWEPSSALLAGPDGLDDLRHLMVGARRWLRPGGLLVLECDPRQCAALGELAARRGYLEEGTVTDLAGHCRAVVVRRPPTEPTVSEVEEVRRALHAGEPAVVPTDTVVGLVARYRDEAAVRASYVRKRRSTSVPVPILVSGPQQAAELIEFDEMAAALAASHWPGGLTLVGRRRGGPDPVSGSPTLGVRAPAVGWLRELIDDVGPVTGSSANLHGEPTPDDAETAARTLGVAAVVQGSALMGVPSTVVDITGEAPVVLRLGAIDLESGK